jgi:hypothetical protein
MTNDQWGGNAEGRSSNAEVGYGPFSIRTSQLARRAAEHSSHPTILGDSSTEKRMKEFFRVLCVFRGPTGL